MRAEQQDEERDDHDDDPRAVRELGPDLDDGDDAGRDRADAIERRLPLPALSLGPDPPPHHTGLRQREAEEDADRVERNERGGIAVEDPDEQHGDKRERDDAVREREPVAARGELAGQIALIGEDAAQAREVGERRIRGQHQDGEGRVLQRVVHEARRRRRGARAGRAPSRVSLGSTCRCWARKLMPRKKTPRMVAIQVSVMAALREAGALERADAVGDGFGAGHGDAPAGKRAQHQISEREPGREAAVADADGVKRVARRTAAATVRVADEELHNAGADEREHRDDECVRRDAERGARLAHAAEVHEHRDDDGGDAERDGAAARARVGRRDGRDAARDRDRDGEDVVREERGGSGEAGQWAQVLIGDGEGSAAPGVGEDRLPVGECDEDEQPDDDGRDRQDVAERGGAEGGEDVEDLVRGVRDRRDRVGGEDGERRRLW